MQNEQRDEPTLPERRRGESILDSIERRTGERARVSLSDGGAEDTPLTRPARDASEFMPRKRGDYNVLGEIARGGMGRILRAHDGDLGRDVAIKVLDPRLANRPDVIQRFVEEAQIGGQLQHPGIVPVYELGLMADERPYFTMKLVKGRTLSDLLASRRTPEENRARMLQIFDSICQTVAYAHTKGVVHRDLKPSNVMVGSFGEVQVVDWGLAKVLARGGIDDELRARRDDMTVIETVRSGPSGSGSDSLAGSVLGTPGYMPPEQARGEVESLDERADVFALGAILCELLTGLPPYVEREGETILQQASAARLDDAYARLEACGAERGLVELARACLAPAPGARLHNAGAVARGIEDHLAATEERVRRAELETTEARVREREERKARRLTVALALTGFVATVAVGGGWVVRERRANDERARIERGLYELGHRVDELQLEGRMDEAVQTSRGALPLVSGRDEGDPLRASAEELVARAEESAAKAQAEAERLARNAVLLDRLYELRVEAAIPLSDQQHVELDEEFARAFREWGVDVSADIVAAVDDLRESGIEEELALALDDWAAVRRWAYKSEPERANELNVLAVDLDPDEVRVALREALVEGDTQTISDIADAPDVLELPPSTLWIVASALRSVRRVVPALDLFTRAIAVHPGDVRLRIAAWTTARDLRLWPTAEHHIGVAAALRSDLHILSVHHAFALGWCGRYPEAIGTIERVIAESGEDPGLVRQIAYMSLSLSDFERTARALERAETLSTLEPQDEAALLFARVKLGELDLETYDRRLSRLGDHRVVANMRAGVRFDGPLDVEGMRRALAIFEESGHEPFEELLATLALAEGRPRDALAALDAANDRRTGDVPNRDDAVVYHALRARAYAALGETSLAKVWLDLAQRAFEDIGGTVRGPWENSHVLQNLLVAEEELNR